ncbi:MAG: hypothetical protein ACPGN3_04745 [Opitutales bacterium]
MNTPKPLLLATAWLSTLCGAYIFGTYQNQDTSEAIEETALTPPDAAQSPVSDTEPTDSSTETLSSADQAAIDKLKQTGGDDILVLLSNLDSRILGRMRQFQGIMDQQSIPSGEASAQLIEGLQNGSLNRRNMWSMLGSIEDADIPSTIQQLAELGITHQSARDISSRLLRRLARNNPAEAAELANSLDADTVRDGAMSSVFSEWARSDPEAAIAWLSDNPDIDLNTLNRSANSAFRTYARQDQEAAISLLNSIEDPEVRDNATRGVFDSILRSPESNIDSVAAFILDQPQETRSALIREAARDSKFSNLESGMEFGELFAGQDPALTQEIYMEFGEAHARDFPQETANWALELEDPNLAENVMGNIMEDWSKRDPEEAGTWLAATEPSPVLDEAYESYALETSSRDPESAITWAEAITDPSLRDNTVSRLATTWAEQDPASASAYVQATQYLSPDARESLLRTFSE